MSEAPAKERAPVAKEGDASGNTVSTHANRKTDGRRRKRKQLSSQGKKPPQQQQQRQRQQQHQRRGHKRKGTGARRKHKGEKQKRRAEEEGHDDDPDDDGKVHYCRVIEYGSKCPNRARVKPITQDFRKSARTAGVRLIPRAHPKEKQHVCELHYEMVQRAIKSKEAYLAQIKHEPPPRVDFDKLPLPTLRKYQIKYKLRDNGTRDDAVRAVEKHFTSQSVSELDVILSFAEAVRRERGNEAASLPVLSTITDTLSPKRRAEEDKEAVAKSKVAARMNAESLRERREADVSGDTEAIAAGTTTAAEQPSVATT